MNNIEEIFMHTVPGEAVTLFPVHVSWYFPRPDIVYPPVKDMDALPYGLVREPYGSAGAPEEGAPALRSRCLVVWPARATGGDPALRDGRRDHRGPLPGRPSSRPCGAASAATSGRQRPGIRAVGDGGGHERFSHRGLKAG
ncbi:hypothetical protein HS041_02340 [Planomonospora sp. ID67723]|nr:hypothetical protein [Planomonospora sp. ID67723]